MPHAANLPSIREIRALADEFGIEMSDQDAQSYRTFMQGPISSYRRLEELPEFRPPVKYPRTPGYRAAAEDNPYNAWYWRCRIEGASSGDVLTPPAILAVLSAGYKPRWHESAKE
jgi:amidase